MSNDDAERKNEVFHLEGGIPVFNSRLSEIERKQKEAETRDDQYKQDQLRINKRLMWFTGLLVLCTAIGSVISGYQASVSKLAASAAQTSANAAIDNAAAAKKQAEASADNAVATKASVTQAISNFHLDQRAWVAAVKTIGVPEVNKPFEITIQARNTGKTFAKRFTMVTVTEPVIGNKQPDFRKEIPFKKNVASVSLLAPNGDYLSTVSPTSGQSLSQASMDDIKSGKFKIFVYGTITYDDVFNCPHWTKFCVHLQSDLKYESCDRHNDADENNCPVPTKMAD
jgi:hypothetical protein